MTDRLPYTLPAAAGLPALAVDRWEERFDGWKRMDSDEWEESGLHRAIKGALHFKPEASDE